MKRPTGTAVALAVFFVVIGFYTSLASLSPTPPVGYDFAGAPTAAAMVVALVLSAAWCAAALARGRARRSAARTALIGSPSYAMLAAWLGSAALSSAFGLDPASGFAVVGMMTLGALFHLALVRDFAKADVARIVLVPYLLAGSLAAASGIAMVVLRRPAALWAYNHGRAAGVFITANQFAAFLIAFIFVSLACALAMRGLPQRLGVVAAPLAAVALLTTFSVAGLLGAAAGGIFYAATLGARRLAIGCAIAVLLGAAVLALRPAAAHDPADRFDRLRTWQAGARVVALFPLTGAGPMAYWRVYPAVRPPSGDPPGTFGALHPHDVYLSLAGETGLVGIAALLFGVVQFVRAIRRGLRERTRNERRFALGVCAALVAVLVQGLFDTVGIVEMTFVWIPYTGLALAAALGGFGLENVASRGEQRSDLGRSTRRPAGERQTITIDRLAAGRDGGNAFLSAKSAS
ncbi:MAG: hypothetical protein M3R44_05710 [Candidatus Eremiobacteraeota bacterium]|nr:hypothetical protein [Candidatus Eremiobacteraeota bacterium]